jgi:hypothetical protein
MNVFSVEQALEDLQTADWPSGRLDDESFLPFGVGP